MVENAVFGQNSSNAVGIYLANGAEARANVVHGNFNGIYVQDNASYSTMRVIANRVYNNFDRGIWISSVYGYLIQSNVIYANSVGIFSDQFSVSNGSGTIENNLMYGNTNQGLVIRSSSAYPKAVRNNTVFQEVGDAIRLENSARDVRLRNNILWVESGDAISVANNSQTGFDSDYNLFFIGLGANAHVGLWNGVSQDALTSWRAATSRDVFSLADDPLFIDPDGADNVLGYDPANGGFDGGVDDNFALAKLSPAIDRGDSWNTPHIDALGAPRTDDPGTPNTGTPDYFETPAASSVYQFRVIGTAQGWQADDQAWSLALPFAFPFYDASYTNVLVSSNGFLQFAGPGSAADAVNGDFGLIDNRRIAPLWDDLRTDGTGDDIYVDITVAGQVTVRWNATNKADGSDVNAAVTLLEDGRIRFDYGAGNANLTPTVGVSLGDGQSYDLSGYSEAANLAGVDSVEWARQPELSQYASSVISFSSQYSASNYSAAQALGEPNVLTYGDSVRAWTAAQPNGVNQYLTLGFATPVYATGVTVRETLGNGFVTKIEAVDMSDQLHTVWSGVDPSQPGAPVDFLVIFARTAFLVKGVRITVDMNHTTTWEEVDAVQLHGDTALNPDRITYYEVDVGKSLFYKVDPVGAAQNWRFDDNNYWNLNLPFAFPFYGTTYNQLYVTPNGFLQFANPTAATDGSNTVDELAGQARIAPLWDDLRTDGAGDDIYVDTTISGRVTIRWDATNKADNSDVHIAVTLFSDGRIRFDYGPGNRNLTPTIGISRGASDSYVLSRYDAQALLASVQSVEFALAPGVADLGAIEFRGSSLDETPPIIVATVPNTIFVGGSSGAAIDSVDVVFSEEPNPLDTRAPANYELRRSGVNGLFGDGDDTVYSLTPTFAIGTTRVTLHVDDGALPEGNYRLTVSGSASIHDLAGLKLDGNGDGTGGDDFIRLFTILPNEPPTVANQQFSVAENSPAGTVVGTVAAIDPNGEVVTFRMAPSDGGNAFAIDPDNGEITVVGATLLDFEMTASFSLTIEVTDGRGLTSTAIVTIDIEDEAEAPVILDQLFSIGENSADGMIIGTVAAIDPDAEDFMTFRILSGNEAGVFGVTAATGQLTVANGSLLDFETTHRFQLTIEVEDSSGLTSSAVVTIDVDDENESPDVNTGNPIAPVTIREIVDDSLPVIAVIDLSNRFADPDADALTITIVSNTGSVFITAALQGNQLVLRQVARQSGAGVIIIRAADTGGLSVETQISIIVHPIYHPADQNKDWEIGTMELHAFALAWLHGESWNSGMALAADDPDFMNLVTNAIMLWKRGGDYHFIERDNGPAPNSWDAGPAAGREAVTASRADASTDAVDSALEPQSQENDPSVPPAGSAPAAPVGLPLPVASTTAMPFAGQRSISLGSYERSSWLSFGLDHRRGLLDDVDDEEEEKDEFASFDR